MDFANTVKVLSVHPKEFVDKWFDMIPGKRLCDPAELKGVCTAPPPLAVVADTYL